MSDTITVDGVEYNVARSFGESRAIVALADGGPYAFVDRDGNGEWQLSGDPPKDEAEALALAELVEPNLDKTVVTIAKDS